MDEEEVISLFEICSNRGKWPSNPERGTLNYQTQQTRVAAASEVMLGEVVPLGRPLSEEQSAGGFAHRLLQSASEASSEDEIRLAPHGFDITHLDAVGHSYFGRMGYLGRTRDEMLDDKGLHFGSITDMLPGIFTRGVFLNVAAEFGFSHLSAGTGIDCATVEAAERSANVNVQSGDAVFIHSGLQERLRAEGAPDGFPREGVLPDIIPWLHSRQVSVYSGDCIERLPSGYDQVLMPLHQIGHTSMGLAILDNVDTEALLQACHKFSRNTFLLVCVPLEIKFGTGSPVNPIAIF
jgi:hypothetical protein